jgi:hypothetical protein
MDLTIMEKFIKRLELGDEVRFYELADKPYTGIISINKEFEFNFNAKTTVENVREAIDNVLFDNDNRRTNKYYRIS